MQGYSAVIQHVNQGLPLTTEWASSCLLLSPEAKVGIMRQGVYHSIEHWGRIAFAEMGGTGWFLPIPQFHFHQQMLSSGLASPASLVVIASRYCPSPEPFSSLLLIGLSLIGKGLPPLHHGLWQLAWNPFLSGWAHAGDFESDTTIWGHQELALPGNL